MISLETSNQETLIPDVGVDPKIREWRKSEFEKLGYRAKVADVLSETQIDLDKARKLIAGGCPSHLVVKILVGTDSVGREDHTYTLNWFLMKTTNFERMAKAITESSPSPLDQPAK